MQITTIGIDLAKSVFQLHAVDADGATVVRKRLRRSEVVGFITATAIAATVTDPSHFRSSRKFSAWLGLTPRQNSSGGKDRLGHVSKMGNGYLRSLSARWINALLEKKPARLVSVAVANKTVRIAWALLVRKEAYQAPMPA